MLFPLIGFTVNFKAHNSLLILKCVLLVIIACTFRFSAGFMTMRFIIGKNAVSLLLSCIKYLIIETTFCFRNPLLSLLVNGVPKPASKQAFRQLHWMLSRKWATKMKL
jgi:hypothetical protein